MARTKKRLKIIIMGHRDSLSYLILSCQEATANFCYKVEGRRASNANSVIHFFLNLNPYWSFNLGPRPCHFVVAHWTGSGFVGLSRGTVYWMKFTQVLAYIPIDQSKNQSSPIAQFTATVYDPDWLVLGCYVIRNLSKFRQWERSLN